MALFRKFPVEVKGTAIGIYLRGSNGSANLVTIYNLVALVYSEDYGPKRPVPESFLKGTIKNALNQAIDQCKVPTSEAKEVRKLVDRISTDFSLEPRMRSHSDFESNAAHMLCCILDFKVRHTWVLDPKVNNYDIIKDLSPAGLVEYCRSQEDQDGHMTGLLNDSANQLTSYGFKSLANELEEDKLSLILCRNQLDIIMKHDGVLYLLVIDENLHNQMPTAMWMVFEQHQENNIFFDGEFDPVEGQPYEQRARDFRTKLTRQREKKAARNKLKKAKQKARRQSQNGESNGASPYFESSEPSKVDIVTSKVNEGEGQVDTKTSIDEDKGAVPSYPNEDLGGSSQEENKVKESQGVDASVCQVSSQKKYWCG